MLIVTGLQIWKKTFLMKKIVIKFEMLSINGLVLTKKKAQIRSKEIALEASSKTFSVNKSLAICSSYRLPS